MQAQLASLVDDSTLSVERSDGQDTVRTLLFESDHRCEVVARSGADGALAVRLQTDARSAFDIELSQTTSTGQSTRTRASEPAVFRRVKAGPTRFVYSLPGDETARRYQTEWVLMS